MGVLTQATTRLRDEIVTSSHARMALRGALVRQAEERRAQVSDLCAAFARDRAGARRAWSECGAEATGRSASLGRNLVIEPPAAIPGTRRGSSGERQCRQKEKASKTME